jgi:hypothetical protein
MIQHVVFFKFKAGTTDEQVDAIADGLAGLPDSIEDIRGFVFGRDVIRSERSYDFGLVSTFDDLEALDRYQVHPEHQKVVALVKAAAESVVAVDFEI